MRGSLFQGISLFITVAVSFYMMPLIVKSLGNRWYGMWTLVGTIIGYYGFLDFGLNSALQAYIARALGKNDYSEIEVLVSTAFRIFIIIGLIAFLIASSIGISSNMFFGVREESLKFRIVMFILGGNSLIQFATTPFYGLYAANYRFDLMSMIETGKLLIRTAALLVALQGNFDIVILSLITVSVEALASIVKLIVAKVVFGRLYFSLHSFQFLKVRQLWSHGKKTLVVNITNILRFKLDAIVITSFLSLSSVTFYSIGSQLVMYFMALVGAIVNIMTPVYAQYYAKNDWNAIRDLFFFSIKISTVVSIFFGSAAVIFCKPFIHIWMGPQYSGSAIVALILLSSCIFNVSLLPATNILYGISKHGAYAKICLLDGIGNLVLSLMLVRRFGINGVAMGTAIPMLAASIWLVFHIRTVLNVRIMDYLRIVGKNFILGIITMWALYTFINMQSINNYLSLFTYAGALLGLEALLFFFVMFDFEERNRIKKLLVRTISGSK